MPTPRCLRDEKYDDNMQGPCSAGQCRWPECAPRLTCCVPFCQRTVAAKPGWTAWICQEHWSAVPRRDRAILTRAKRKARKAGLRWNEACTRLWNRCKRIAIERAGGI